jgi:hypothetical protein
MTITIPIAIDNQAKECRVDLLTLDGEPIVQMFSGHLAPGVHSIEYDPSDLPGGGIEAGLYILRLNIDGHTDTYPIQYMP